MNKKGQTLVEVIVALGILAMVFAGTVTLIANVVGLEMSARSRTEAIAYTQKVLNVAIAKLQPGCDDVFFDPENTAQPPTSLGSDTKINVTCERVDQEFRSPAVPEPCSGVTNGLLKVTASFDWTNRDGSTENYTISQVTRRNP